VDELAEMKARSRAVWAAGDFPTIATLIVEPSERIVEHLGIGPGDEVLDVACGTGNAALPAALRGARVVALDLVPELLDVARERAAEAGVEVELLEGDAEELPFADESFDVVLSVFGVMFAPRHAVAAQEAARVLRPGGRIGLCNWTPEGSVGEFFRTVGGYAPPLPPDAIPPFMWGTEEHVRRLFDGTGVELEFEREYVTFTFDSVDHGVETFTTKFGPIVVLQGLIESQGRWDAFTDDLAALIERHNEAGDGSVSYQGEYLVAVGRKER
jgi:ubiquinone/menaquinone biosynthesis C-methylase UbiE